jgi:hypothetical protein
MSETHDLKIKELGLDPRNPRLANAGGTQTDILYGIWLSDPAKLLGLAHHISEHGMDPTTVPAVIVSEIGEPPYTMVEGNRRLAALTALADPAKVADLLSRPQLAKLHRYSTAFHEAPLAKLRCVVFPTRDDANRWIELRHSADPTGAGVIMWGAVEKARFKKRDDINELAVQVLDVVKREGQLSPSEQEAIKKSKFITTLRRLTNDPAVRTRLKIDTDSDGKLTFGSPRTKTVKALKHIVSDFAGGAKKVRDVFYKDDRKDYLDELAARGVIPSAPPSAAPVAAPAIAANAARASTKGVPRDRKRLFPSGMSLNFHGNKRIGEIYGKELRLLGVADFPNAVAVLLRVFLELSVDCYLKRERVKTDAEIDSMKLKARVHAAVDHLHSMSKLDRKEVRAIRRALQDSKGSIGPSEIDSLHAYVHNEHFRPKATDLFDAADYWRLFLEKIWA